MADTTQPAKITLHWLEVSRSHRILWLLEELGIHYELKTYKRGKDKLADPKLKDIHPLGKSPVITVETAASETPLVIAESAAIVEYLCGYYGKWLVPKRYREGKEDQIGGESESWLRHRFFMHYAEGSIMPLMLMALIVSSVNTSQ
jgi:glutathione S-transferase